jgi:hypothetical protein
MWTRRQDMKNPLDQRRKELADGNRGTFQYFLKVKTARLLHV